MSAHETKRGVSSHARPPVRHGLISAWVTALPFWLLPALALGLLSYSVYPAPPAAIVRSALGLAVISIVVFVPMAAMCATQEQRFTAHAIVGVLFSLFTFIFAGAGSADGNQGLVQFAVASVAAVLLVAYGPGGIARAVGPILGLMAALLILALAAGYWRAETLFRRAAAEPAPAVAPLLSPLVRPTPAPDIYQILLDSFGEPAALKRNSGIDVGPVVAGLRASGFEVVDGATANYDQTYLSLSSMWNVNYLDAIAKGRADSTSRVSLHSLIARSAVATWLRNAGYAQEVFGADYSASHEIEADRCYCPPILFGEFESAVLGLTPLGVTGLAGLEYRPHRRYILRTFEALEQFTPGDRPVFLFAHVLAPHMPIVFDERGDAATAAQWRFSFGDGSSFEGTREMLQKGYEGQARYIARRAGAAASALLDTSRRRGRPAIVIVHGDHGIRVKADPDRPARADAAEVLPILLAIRWSPGGAPAQPVRSLVNVYREILRRYFGAALDHLPDRGHVTSAQYPFRMIETDANGQ